MSSMQPADCRDAIHWFVNNVGLYTASARGIFASDFTDDQEPVLEAAIINLKSRGINPVVVTGEQLYQQADNLWQHALQATRFGRPVAGKAELEMSGSDLLVLKNIEAPEAAHRLWYLFHHVLYPRALANKPLVITTQLGHDEFVLYGAGCDDFEYAGRKVTWEKVFWLIEAMTIDLHHFQLMKDEGLVPMLKSEYALFKGLKERGLPVTAQHVLGDYLLDIAAFEPQIRKRRDDSGPKLDIECDIISTLDGGSHGQAKRNLLLLSDGWNILRFSIAEIQSDLSACIDTTMEVWQQGRRKSTPGRLLSGQAETAIPEIPVDDEVQRLAITHGGGPAAVDGGAGTGKSTCVTHRVAHLLGQGISPEKILVISHSNETLRALKTAVELLTDKLTAQRVNFYSWHDLGLKILKENLGAIKRKPPLKVESNPQKVIQRLIAKYKKEMDPVMLELSEELDEFTICSLISLYKANLITPKQLKEKCKTDIDELVTRVYQGYEDQLQKSNRIDRDDMVSLAALTLVDQPDVRAKYQFQFEYVVVDEFQEATASGDLLARVLAFPQDNLYLAGNEDEAIYESKGGLPRLMAEVSIKLPNARCYVLEKNWRSHPAIVDHSKQLLHGLTRRRIQKDMVAGWGTPPTAAIVGPQMLASESAEAEWVADETAILIDSGRSPQDIAVLYRYHRYGLIIEEAMSRRGIRCVTTHPEAGLIPDEVGDVMAFLRLVMDPDGPKARESFERVCQLRVKEVDPKLSSTIASFAEANNLSYLKAVEIYSEAVAEQSCKELEQLVRIIRTMHQENLPPAETISLLKRTQRLNEYYKSIKVPPGVNYEPLRKLSHLEEEARKFKSVAEFVKSQSASGKSADADAVEHVVHILTLHEAKGKEFPVVYLVGLAEGLFPAESASDREEERRLCYVGMTRARELLYLSYPAIFNDVALQPSSFLIDARLMPQPGMHVAVPPGQVAGTASGAAMLPPVQQPAAAAPAMQNRSQQPVQQPPMQQPQPMQNRPQQPVQQPPVQQQQPMQNRPQQPVQQPPVQQPQPMQNRPQQPVQQPPVQQPQPMQNRPQQPVQQPPVPQPQPMQNRPQQPVQQPPVQQPPVQQPQPMQNRPQQPVQQPPVPSQPRPQQQMPPSVPVQPQQQPAAAQSQQEFAPPQPQQPQVRPPIPVQPQMPVPQQPQVQQPVLAQPEADTERRLPAGTERSRQDGGAPEERQPVPAQPEQPQMRQQVPAQPEEPPPRQILSEQVPQQQPVQPVAVTNFDPPTLPPNMVPLPEAPATPKPQPSQSVFDGVKWPGDKPAYNLRDIWNTASDDEAQPAPSQAVPVQNVASQAVPSQPAPNQDVASQPAEPPQGDAPNPAETSQEWLPMEWFDEPQKPAVQEVVRQEKPQVEPRSQADSPSVNEPEENAEPPQSNEVPETKGKADKSKSAEKAPRRSRKQQAAAEETPPPVAEDIKKEPEPISPPPPDTVAEESFSPEPTIIDTSPKAPIEAEQAEPTVIEEVQPQMPPAQPSAPAVSVRQSDDEFVAELLGENITPQPAVPATPAVSARQSDDEFIAELLGENAKPPAPPAAPGVSGRQSDDEFVAQLLGEDVPPGVTVHDTKRAKPKDNFWQGKFKTKLEETQPEPVAPPKPPNELDLSLAEAPPPPIVPPSHGFPPKPTRSPQQVWAGDSTNQQSDQDYGSAGQPQQYAPPQPQQQYTPQSQSQYSTPPQQEYSAPPQHSNSPITVPHCPGCSSPLEAGSQFCGECGYKLQTRIPACHGCGSPLEPSAKFCGECGSRRMDPAAAQLDADPGKPTQRGWVNKLTKFIDE